MTPNKKPTMLTIRETAKTGILPEHALRLLLKSRQTAGNLCWQKSLYQL